MTDTAEAGSVTPEASAGTPAQPTAPVDKGSTPDANTNPFSGLSEGTRQWVETKGYKSYEAIADTAMEQERMLGSSIRVPGEEATAEDWAKFHSRLPEQMRPVTSSDKIEYKLPEGLPEGLPYSNELADASKTWAVEAGATPAVAQAYHDRFVGYMADQVKAQQALVAQSVEDAHDALVKDWGTPDSEGFKAEKAMADRAMKKLGLVDAFKSKGILLDDGALTDPQIALAFAQVGKAMFKEDVIDIGGVHVGENPFKGSNLTEQSALVKSDPERAKRLIRESGKDPRHFFSTNPL